MKSKVLISLLIAIWSTGALANNDWGENFSWSVECDEGASYESYGPDWYWMYDAKFDEETPLCPLLGLGLYLASNATFVEAYLEWEDATGGIHQDNLSILKDGEFGSWGSGIIGNKDCHWLGNDSCGSDLVQAIVPCIKLHNNCRNVVKIKVNTTEKIPTVINFTYSAIVNGHPTDYYADVDEGNWNYFPTTTMPEVKILAHRYLSHEGYSFDDPLIYFPNNYPNGVFSEVLDWGYEPYYDYESSAPVDDVTIEIEDDGSSSLAPFISISPNSIDGPGEYNVTVSCVVPESEATMDWWTACWGTNFQFDLDGGGTVDYTVDIEKGQFSVSGEGIQGKYHKAFYPISIHPKFIPNPGKVLESVTALYDSGISNEIEEVSLPFTFNEEGGYYEIGGDNVDIAYPYSLGEGEGFLELVPGWMNTIKVRFKDDNTTTIHFIDEGSKFEINGHPFYDDCQWKEIFPPIIGKTIRIIGDGDEIEPSYYTSEEMCFEYSLLDDENNTYCLDIDWESGEGIKYDCEDKGPWQVSLNPSSITGPGEYDVKVTYTIPEDKWESLGAAEFWGTNFQFDLDGGGTIDYTVDSEQGQFSVSGVGIQGKYHTAGFPLIMTPKIKPNQGKVLESVTVLYDSGISNEIQEISLPFTFNEESGYYEVGEYFEEVGVIEAGDVFLYDSWMNTIKVRFKDVDIIVKANNYTRVYGEENPDFEYTVEDGELTGTPVITCDATPESPVGTYDIVISKGSVENNNVVFEKGTLTIEKAPLTIEAGEYEINQGDALPEFEPNYIGFKNGEMFNVLTRLPVFTCPYIPSDGPGTYTISVGGAEADNYEMTYVDGTLRVKEAPAPNNTLSSETVEIRTGGDGHISLELNNEDSIIMVEFYMQLPEGISLSKDEDGYWDATLNTNRSNRHSLEVEKNSEGLYHFLVYSTRNNALKGNDGELININIVCDENMEAGIYQATLRNILFNDIDKKEIVLPDYTFSLDVKDVLLGDVNGDWKINGSDIVLMVDHIMGRPSDSFIIAAAELTGDGQINGSDLVEEISLVMSQSISTNTTPGTSNAPRYLATGLTMDAGSNGEAVLGVTNNGSFILAQMTLQLSEGQQLTDITTDSRHHVEYRQLADDRYFVLCYSGNNDEFISKDEMLTFHVTGEGSVSVSEAMLVDADRQECYFAPVSTGQTTLIERVTYSLSQPADIYSVSGAMVRKQATSLKGLAKGVYFINGNKIIID